MAAIGGIFNMDGGEVSADKLLCISHAQSHRGGHRRSAYINGGGGVFSGEGQDGGNIGEHLPITVKRREKNITLVFDGSIYPEGKETEWGASFFGESGGEFALESYLRYGTAMAEHFSGEYAIAVYDEERAEFLLLRDSLGCRPLYFIRDDNSICFASEIKGLSAAYGGLETDRRALCEHILSPCDSHGGTRIFHGLNEVTAGGGCILSRLGIAPLVHKGMERNGKMRGQRQVINEGFACPDEEGMKRLLLEILYAFDYPQFDIFMPTFIRDLLYAKDRGLEYSAAVLDGTLCMDIGYSNMRRDRLSVMAGVRSCCIPPDKSPVRERDAKKMERIIMSLLAETDKQAVAHVLGKDAEALICREKNTAKRVRTAAMVIQSVLMLEHFNTRIS